MYGPTWLHFESLVHRPLSGLCTLNGENLCNRPLESGPWNRPGSAVHYASIPVCETVG